MYEYIFHHSFVLQTGFFLFFLCSYCHDLLLHHYVDRNNTGIISIRMVSASKHQLSLSGPRPPTSEFASRCNLPLSLSPPSETQLRRPVINGAVPLPLDVSLKRCEIEPARSTAPRIRIMSSVSQSVSRALLSNAVIMHRASGGPRLLCSLSVTLANNNA